MRNSFRYADVDLVGQRHGMLTVVKKLDKGRSWYLCKCDCGKEKVLLAHRFFEYSSCGCQEKKNRELIGERSKTHGMTETRLYAAYCGMKSRCSNPHYKYYSKYGGRGIKVCKEWKESFDAFAEWAYANGYVEGASGVDQSIDRIDVDGDYCPENCKWTNQTQQVRNRSNTRWVIYKGEKVNPYDFAKQFNITNKVYVYRHLDKNETGEQILESWNNLQARRNGRMYNENQTRQPLPNAN